MAVFSHHRESSSQLYHHEEKEADTSYEIFGRKLEKHISLAQQTMIDHTSLLLEPGVNPSVLTRYALWFMEQALKLASAFFLSLCFQQKLLPFVRRVLEQWLQPWSMESNQTEFYPHSTWPLTGCMMLGNPVNLAEIQFSQV